MQNLEQTRTLLLLGINRKVSCSAKFWVRPSQMWTDGILGNNFVSLKPGTKKI